MSVDLVYHASKGNLFNVRRLLEHGILPDATTNTGETALFHAALAGHLHVVVDLLKYGADPNRCSINGLSPVNAACMKDNVKSLAALLYHGGRLEHPTLSESAMATARRYRSRRVEKYIISTKENALQNFTGDFVDVNEEEDKEEDSSIHAEFQPGSGSSIPFADTDQLTTLHEGVRFSFIAPRVTFRNACWNRIAVTVKSSSYKKDIEKDLEMLCNLRHPRVAMILAGVSSPNTGLTSLVLDYFKLGNLHHMLYVSKLDLSLAQRINILLDISKAMKYVHNKKILHCFINSYSVLVDGSFRAKIGNFEHAQKIDDESFEGTSINHVAEQHAWMAPCQLNGEPANKNSDVYSFGALMWECLAIKQPWSWLIGKTIYQALWEECLRLPVLQDWTNSIKQIFTECTGPEQERLDFDTITQHLEDLSTSDLQVKEEILESAFEYWLTGKRIIKQRRKSSGVKTQASRISRDISALRMDSESDEEDEDDDAKIRLLKRRSSSVGFSQRRNTIHQGLMNIVHAFQHNKKDLRKQRDTVKYGVEVAEQLATVRSLWKRGKHHVRHRWAKEMYIRRKLEGDIKRVKMSRRFKERGSDFKARQAQQGQRVRRLSHGAESIARLRTIAGKYEKWDWAKYTTGHHYHPPEDKYEVPEEDEGEDIEEETVISRDVLRKTADSSGLHLLPLEAGDITVLNEEDEQLEASIDERFEDGDNAERIIGGDTEVVVDALEHKHVKQVDGQEQQQQQEYDENDEVNQVVMKEGKEEEKEGEKGEYDNKEGEEDDEEDVEGGEVDEEGEEGEGEAGGVDEEDLEEKDKEEEKDEEGNEEDEEELKNNEGGGLHNNEDDMNREDEHDNVPADKSSYSEHQHSINIIENELQTLDTNGNEASNEDKDVRAKSITSDDLRTGVNRQTSQHSREDGESQPQKVSLSADAVNILDEFSQWLDDYCEDIPSTSDFGDGEVFRDINDVLECNESSREVTPENDTRQSSSQETIHGEETESLTEKGSNRTDGRPITAADMPLPSDDDELEIAQPSTSGVDFSKKLLI